MDWSRVSIRQYVKFYSLLPFDSEDIDAHCEVLSIFYGQHPDEYLKLSRDQFAKKVNSLRFLYEPIPEKKSGFIFRAGGVKYEVNPLLNKIKAGEYIDLTVYGKDEKTAIANLHNILAIFCKPVPRWFQKAETDRAKIAAHLADHMNIVDAYSLSAFFLKSSKRLLRATQDCMTQKAIKQIKKAIRMVEAGTQPSTTSQGVTERSGTTTLI